MARGDDPKAKCRKCGKTFANSYVLNSQHGSADCKKQRK